MFLSENDGLTKKRFRDSSEDHKSLYTENEQPTKRRRVRPYNDHRPPGFWDSLSKVHLTKGALREFDRRVLASQRDISHPNRSVTPSPITRPVQQKRFARHGGPDLSHIRGFASSTSIHGGMSKSSSGYKRSSAGDSSSTRKSKSSYDPNFEQNMRDCGIYAEGHEPDDAPQPRNLETIHSTLTTSRASLSPSRFSETDFKTFKRLNARALGETRAMNDVFTIIEGNGRYNYHTDGPDHPFIHLEPLSEYLPKAKPDLYDGAPQQVDPRVRDELGRQIIPCNNTSRPVVPNFFVEGKSAGGRADVAKLQACHDGATGARAIHSLENFRRHEPRYDGNINTFSSTYHPGTATLQLYGHHITAPTPERHAEYYMTQIKGYQMTSDLETFHKGATAFRNLRELAESNRDSAIEAANRIARHTSGPSSGTLTNSRSMSSHPHGDESDTSTDELAPKETVPKRPRHRLSASLRQEDLLHSHESNTTTGLKASSRRSANPARHSQGEMDSSAIESSPSDQRSRHGALEAQHRKAHEKRSRRGRRGWGWAGSCGLVQTHLPVVHIHVGFPCVESPEIS